MAITLDATALVDVQDDVKPFLEIAPTDTDKDTLLTQLVNWVSPQIERIQRREFVTRGSRNEKYTLPDGLNTSILSVKEWPIVSVTTVHEDSTRQYGASEKLVENTDYIVSKPSGKIIRIWGSDQGPRAWLHGFRAIQVVYEAGYADTAAVPAEIKLPMMREIALLYNEIVKKRIGISSSSDATGSYERFVPGGINAMDDRVKSQLMLTARVEVTAGTFWEVD